MAIISKNALEITSGKVESILPFKSITVLRLSSDSYPRAAMTLGEPEKVPLGHARNLHPGQGKVAPLSRGVLLGLIPQGRHPPICRTLRFLPLFGQQSVEPRSPLHHIFATALPL